jgi:hypothetical protein
LIIVVNAVKTMPPSTSSYFVSIGKNTAASYSSVQFGSLTSVSSTNVCFSPVCSFLFFFTFSRFYIAATSPRAYAFVDPELVSASATASNQVDFFFLRAQLTSSLFITHNNLMNFSFLNLRLGCQNFANISKSLSQG